MGIKDVRDGFLAAGDGLRCSDCELHTVQDGNNSQRLVISGFDAKGAPFHLDSGPFDPKTSPVDKAKAMALEVLQRQTADFQQPPQQAAGQR